MNDNSTIVSSSENILPYSEPNYDFNESIPLQTTSNFSNNELPNNDNVSSSSFEKQQYASNKSTNLPSNRLKRKRLKYKALKLGPLIEQEIVTKTSYDIFTLQDNNERIAWKPPRCHKVNIKV